MRACEGCRRRKIKCDAATTNTWPCSACVRLKLHCVPPMVQYDRDFAPNQVILDTEPNSGEYHDNSSGSGEEEYSHHPPHMKHRKGSRVNIPSGSYIHRSGDFRNISPTEHHALQQTGNVGMQYSHIPQHASPGDALEPTMSSLQQFQTVQYSPHHPSMRHHSEQWDDSSYTAASVSGVLEQLKIDDSGVGKLSKRTVNYIDLIASFSNSELYLGPRAPFGRNASL